MPRLGKPERWTRCTRIVYLECIHVKTRDAGAVRSKAMYLALGMAGEKEIRGL
jgi:putative transposase